MFVSSYTCNVYVAKKYTSASYYYKHGYMQSIAGLIENGFNSSNISYACKNLHRKPF